MKFLVFALTLMSVGLARAQEASLPPTDQFYLYLLVGQSNMAGRGEVQAEDKQPHPRVLTLGKDMKWVPAVDPIHFDKPVAGVGLGVTFGRLMAEAQPGVTIGLIPCAVGGSPIASWETGGSHDKGKFHPWDEMVPRLRAAMSVGTLKGILWHQGESDCNPNQAQAYERRLHALIARLRDETKSPAMPFLAGQLGKFEGKPWTPSHDVVDQAHRQLPEKVPHTAFISSEGLTDKGDKLHFDSKSMREFGKRYAEAFIAQFMKR